MFTSLSGKLRSTTLISSATILSNRVKRIGEH